MTQQSFVSRREAFWTDFEASIRRKGKNLKAGAGKFPLGYREITQDLNTARAHGFDPALIERLNSLVMEGNQILYTQRSWSFRGAALFFLKVFPQAVRSQWRSLGAAALIFFGLFGFMCILCVHSPTMVYQLIGEDVVRDLESMYNPESYRFLTPREVSSDADMFGFYVYNNVSIAFRTFAGGILGGIGSLFILCINGIFLGAATGHIINVGFGDTFFPFVIGHGSFELIAIVLSAQAGLLLGWRLFVTRGLSRGASLRIAGKTALPIIAGAALMLILAAAIEAFWSSRHELPLVLRYSAGAFGWLLVIMYFLFAGRGGEVS